MITMETFVSRLPKGYGKTIATQKVKKASVKKPAKKPKKIIEKFQNDVKIKIDGNSPAWLVKLAAKLN